MEITLTSQKKKKFEKSSKIFYRFRTVFAYNLTAICNKKTEKYIVIFFELMDEVFHGVTAAVTHIQSSSLKGLCFIFFASSRSETFVSLHASCSYCLPAAFQPPHIVSWKSSAHSNMNMHINLSPQHIARTVHQKKKFLSNYTSKSAIITTLYIICIFQLIFKSCIGFCMQIYNIFRIRYITIKSISIQPLPCFPLISRVPW